MTTPLLHYLQQMHATRGRVVAEAGLYPALQNFLNEISAAAKAGVRVMVHPRSQGAGIPDFAILDEKQDANTLPTHGVIEAKDHDHNLDELASSDQVKKYLEKYGQVLVTNYYQFALVTLREGKAQIEERYDLAASADAFWQAAPQALVKQHAAPLHEFVLRVYRRNTPLSSPQEVAWWLASYARQAKARLEGLEQSDHLRQLQADLEAALEIRFSGADGDHFFRSTLVQTLFYGLFAAWVLWHERGGKGDFDLWRDTRKIAIPVINQLFHQFTDPEGLEKLGLGDYLEATVKTLNRIEGGDFFAKFETENAIQYFYEPFLEAFDPELRKTLGVWYTPPEIVRYMVRRVDVVLRTELGIEEGLASRDVVILDPCCGTGAYLLEAMQLIYERVAADKGARRAADVVRDATQERIYGFEIMPAPFVVAHLQVGLRLARWGTQAEASKRTGIYLTNALTDWDDAKPRTIRLPGLKEEQDSAREVKQSRKILVVLGNPPYNAYAGTAETEDEKSLVAVYKHGLSDEWGIRKYNLDDLYVRFFRLAEHCIAELNGQERGVVCYISNFSYLSDPSYVVMRQRFLGEFDRIWIDSLNGDSRETGKRIPIGLPNAGAPDPSVFSMPSNPAGIRVGTAVGLFVRKQERLALPEVHYRDYWGRGKRQALLEDSLPYQRATPTRDNRFSFRPMQVSSAYAQWPRLVDLAAEKPAYGHMETRGFALISIDRQSLTERMEKYLNPDVTNEEMMKISPSLMSKYSRYDGKTDRAAIISKMKYSESFIKPFQFKPFDTRYCYSDAQRPLWSEPSMALSEQAWEGNSFIVTRTHGVKGSEGIPIYFTNEIFERDVIMGHARAIPFFLKEKASAKGKQKSMLAEDGTARPNLSPLARQHLASLGYTDVDSSPHTGALLWLHALAIGYSPAYLHDHADGISQDFPRVPLPATRNLLEASAALGRQIADLLDVQKPLRRPDLAAIGQYRSTGSTSDYRLTVGWGNPTSKGVMPGKGRISRADDGTLNIHLNDSAAWSGIPQAVWDYTIGGYQVLKKWLSYREEKVLGRALTGEEVDHFTDTARRIAALIGLSEALDANYRACAG